MLDAEGRESRRRWLRGWAFAGALHGVVAGALMAKPWAAPPPTLAAHEPALALELAPLPAATAAAPSDRPVAPTPQVAQPERRAPPLQRKQPVPMPPTLRQAEPQASPPDAPTEPAQAATVEAAPPPSPSPEPRRERVAAAPALGSAMQPSSDAAVSWEAQVSARLDRAKRYPAEARWARHQDTVYADIVLDRNGRLVSVRIGRSQGFAALDDEVLELVRRVTPFPPPPPEVSGEKIALRVPVEFYIGGR